MTYSSTRRNSSTPSTCAAPRCRNAIEQPATGRPRLYCCDACRQAALRERRFQAEQSERARWGTITIELPRHHHDLLMKYLDNSARWRPIRVDRARAASAITQALIHNLPEQQCLP